MRLTKSIRTETIENAVRKQLGDRLKEWEEKANKSAREAFVHTMTAEQREWLDAAPEGVSVPTQSTVYAYLGDVRRDPVVQMPYLKFRILDTTSKISFSFPAVKVLPTYSYSNNYLEEDTWSDWPHLREALLNIYQDYKHLATTLETAMQSCNTYNQVKELYPSLVEFLPKPKIVTKALVITDDKVVKAMACAKEGDCSKDIEDARHD